MMRESIDRNSVKKPMKWKKLELWLFACPLLLPLFFYIWKAIRGPALRELQPLQGRNELLHTIAFSGDGKLLATGGGDRVDTKGEVDVWDVKTWTLKQTLKGHKARVSWLTFSHDDKSIISADDKGELRLWNLQDGALIHRRKEKDDYLTEIALSPDGKQLASAEIYGGMITILDTKNLAHLRSIKEPEPDRVISSIAFSPDGTTLAVAGGKEESPSQTVKFWNIQTGKLLRTLKNGAASTVAFSPSGQLLVTGSTNGDIGVLKLWDVQSGDLRQTLTEQDKPIITIAFSPDGRTLGVGSQWMGWDSGARGKLTLWDVQTRSIIQTLTSFGSGEMVVQEVIFSPDNRILAATDGGVVKLWDLSSFR